MAVGAPSHRRLARLMTDHPAVPPPTDEPAPAGPSVGDVNATCCATLVDEWVRCGLRHAVVAPGSRSTPVAVALASDERVVTHVVLDERSAAFTALGLGLATGRPALLLCTSGTAAAEFHAAVVEAHQAAVPMLVVTADRPPELHGVWAPQTIDQRELYGGSVRWYCEPGPPSVEGAPWWRDLARDAWTRTLGAVPGPVHLDLAFREPLVGEVGELPPAGDALPPARPGAGWALPDEELARLAGAIAGRRGIVVAGVRTVRSDDAHAAGAAAERDAVIGLARQLGWPVLADAPSGCRVPDPLVVAGFDVLLRHGPTAESLRPEVVLRLGGAPASKVLDGFLAGSGALQVGVDRADRVPDPQRVLARSLHADPVELCRRLAAVAPAPAPAGWAEGWAEAERVSAAAVSATLAAHTAATEPAVAVDLLASLAKDATLVVSSSMPVRDLEWFARPRDGVRVLSNRGANGIDGVTSTAVGVALSGVPTALLVGDLAFLHDVGALVGLARRRADLVVVVVDNDGGGIFSFLPQRDRLPSERFEQLFGTPHGTDLVAVAAAHGLPAERVSSRAGVQAALAGALTRGGVRVVVVDSDRDVNVAVHRELNDAAGGALAAGRYRGG